MKPNSDIRANIIVVEDDSSSGRSLKILLEEQGCYVDIFATGEELLQKLDEHSMDYDFVLSNIQLPGISGFELTRVIRKRHDGNEELPVFAYTCFQKFTHEKLALDAGMSGFLEKPLMGDDLDFLLKFIAQCHAKHKKIKEK